MNLILSLACDEAKVRDDGKLDILGAFNELQAPGFPAAQERMTVVFVVEWTGDTNGDVPLRADLLDEDDKKVLTIQGHTEVTQSAPGRAPAQTRLILPVERVVFPHAGRYRFELQAGDERAPAFSMFVGEEESE